MLRSICSLAIGILLVVWPEAAMIYLVIAVGALFLVPGLIALWAYFFRRKEEDGGMFPVAALGSALFGLWLMMMPDFFVSLLMYILGVLLVLAGIRLLVQLASVRHRLAVLSWLYAVSVLVLLAGIVVLLNPFATASVPFIVLGVSCIVYALSDFVSYCKFRKETGKVQEIEAEEMS